MGMNAALNRASWPQYPARAVDRWFLAADLGQSIDPTAVCALNHRVAPLDKWIPDERRRQWKQEFTQHFDVRHLQRLPLGMSYPEQVHHVAALKSRQPLDNGELVIDETGVGRAVGDLFDAAGLSPGRVTITAGLASTQHGARTWHVPKGVLVSNLEAKLHTGELRIAAGLAEANALQDELKDFKRKVSEAGRVTFNARNGAHDDLVLAVAIGAWFATNGPVISQQRLGI
jgi:hypothetical protein